MNRHPFPQYSRMLYYIAPPSIHLMPYVPVPLSIYFVVVVAVVLFCFCAAVIHFSSSAVSSFLFRSSDPSSWPLYLPSLSASLHSSFAASRPWVYVVLDRFLKVVFTAFLFIWMLYTVAGFLGSVSWFAERRLGVVHFAGPGPDLSCGVLLLCRLVCFLRLYFPRLFLRNLIISAWWRTGAESFLCKQRYLPA